MAGNMLHLTPNEVLGFAYGEDTECVLNILCIAVYPVTYKIQTTSPEKFRVRPRCGIIMPGEEVPIKVLLKPEHKLADGNKDKFLIMAVPLPDNTEETPHQLAEIWKCKQSNNSIDIEHHRVCCQYMCEGQPCAMNGNANETADKSMAMFMNKHGKDKSATDHTYKVERQVRHTQILQYLTLILICFLGIAVAYLIKLEIYGDGLDTSDRTNAVDNLSPECSYPKIQ